MEPSGVTEIVAANDNLPRSRDEAKRVGAKFYFTGDPCIRGHLSTRRNTNCACSECDREKAKEKYWKTRDEKREETNLRHRNRYWANVDSERDRLRELKRKQRAENPGRDKDLRDIRKLTNPNEDRDRVRKWRADNPEKAKKAARRDAKRFRSTPKGRLSSSISSGIKGSIQKGSKARRHWENLVGYTVEQLKDHLEKRFLPGMSWGNYGDWEIDHIVPIAAHNYETPDDIDFMRCWALSNLRPLWKSDNRSKGAKLDKPFQPSLALSIPLAANDNNPVKKDNAA
jgi:hypothetical protein